jgi:hypothetical protein
MTDFTSKATGAGKSGLIRANRARTRAQAPFLLPLAEKDPLTCLRDKPKELQFWVLQRLYADHFKVSFGRSCVELGPCNELVKKGAKEGSQASCVLTAVADQKTRKLTLKMWTSLKEFSKIPAKLPRLVTNARVAIFNNDGTSILLVRNINSAEFRLLKKQARNAISSDGATKQNLDDLRKRIASGASFWRESEVKQAKAATAQGVEEMLWITDRAPAQVAPFVKAFMVLLAVFLPRNLLNHLFGVSRMLPNCCLILRRPRGITKSGTCLAVRSTTSSLPDAWSCRGSVLSVSCTKSWV